MSRRKTRKIHKADEDERLRYDGVYPLWGYILVKNTKTKGLTYCAVEKCSKANKDDPTYEVTAPEHMKFEPYGTHFICCWNLKEVEACADKQLVECESNCLCRKEDEK